MKRYNIFHWFKQSYVAIFLRILLDHLFETCIETKYMASFGMLKNPLKLKTHIDIKVHALEKGMSIGKTRYGFGKKKALEILHDLNLYLSNGGDKEFAEECCTIIDKYLKFNDVGKADMSDVKFLFERFCNKYNIKMLNYGGIFNLSHEDIQAKQHSTFDIFSQSRFSCRDFGTTPIDKEKLQNALELSERTPSACNRQSQHVHIYFDKDKKDKLCSLQGGSKGFYEDFQGVILICEELTGYSSAETNLPYVDGGLYAMNLLYSLHFYDIAAIPLTMARHTNYIQKILKEMSIPLNQVPILLIGIGSYKDNWRVAQSHRKDWHEYTTINK